VLENFVAENFIEFFVGAEQSRGKKGSEEKSLCVGGCCVRGGDFCFCLWGLTRLFFV